MNLQLVIPYANWPVHDVRSAMAPVLDTPSLTRLIGRGLHQKFPPASLNDALAQTFAMNQLAIAPLTLSLDLPDEEPGYWLRADPVHLRPDRDRLIMLDSQAFTLTQDEASRLCTGLNDLFAEDGFRFVAATPYRWYLRLPADPAVTFTPFDDALGRNIDTLLPQGPTALAWHKLLNEMQMCLYGHSVNDARVAAGQAAINSVWLWGGGLFPMIEIPVTYRGRVFGDDVVLAALMRAAADEVHSLPATVRVIDHDALVLLPHLRTGMLYGDMQAWLDGWQRLESDWLAPTLAGIRSGRVATLSLQFPELGLTVRVDKRRLRRFWQRPLWPWEI